MTKTLNHDGSLPPGVKVVPFYDRSSLIALTTHTVLHNLIFGILLVFLIQWIFLGNFRSALIVGINIPFALFFATILMVILGESASRGNTRCAWTQTSWSPMVLNNPHGITLLERTRKDYPRMPVIVTTAPCCLCTARFAVNSMDASSYLLKPFHAKALLIAVWRTLAGRSITGAIFGEA